MPTSQTQAQANPPSLPYVWLPLALALGKGAPADGMGSLSPHPLALPALQAATTGARGLEEKGGPRGKKLELSLRLSVLSLQ